MFATLSALCMSAACNEQTIEQAEFPSGPTLPGPELTPQSGEMDVLWVVDNSSSMCEEQEVLRENFSNFVNVLAETNLDFHIALTTTHAPESSFGVIEPLAEEGSLQSTPQPVPGNNQACLRGEGEGTAFKPLRASIEVAKGCLADPAESTQYDWSEAQIECALQSETAQGQSGCLASTGLLDRNGPAAKPDGSVDTYDLFPLATAYRPIPKVLRAEAYRLKGSGELDVVRLTDDFACMATVGTRGDTYEKGLRAAVRAVSPELTGGAVEIEAADTSAPNHGFVRQGAGFALIFVTDENDCSHDGSMMEHRNSCGSDLCTYQNSSALAEGESKLVRVEELAGELRANLAATKQLSGSEALREEQLLIASIHGTSKRYAGPLPELCTAENTPKLEAVCESKLGSADSGDRYERFMRQFENFYPNSVVAGAEDPEAARLDFSRYEPLGLMCTDTFAPALTAIAEFIARPSGGCLETQWMRSCEGDKACGAHAYSGEAGACGAVSDGQGGEVRFCESDVTVVAEALNQEAMGRLEALSLCVPGSIRELATTLPSCVVAPRFYGFEPCPSGGARAQVTWRGVSKAQFKELEGFEVRPFYELGER